MFRSVGLLALGLFLGGCASYWSARGRDAADLLTLAATTGVGAKIQAGPFQAAPAALLVDVGGLRGGRVFATDLGEGNPLLPMDVGALWWSSSIFALPEAPEVEGRGKAYFAFPAGARVEELFARHTATVPFLVLPRATWAEEKLSLRRVSSAYFGQVEVALALAGGVRVGTNLAEWLDFVAGWCALDPLDDDLPGHRSRKDAPHGSRTP